MPRSSDAQTRMVTSMIELMYNRSYGDVGVADVCKHAGVTKGSFYHFFPSKKALALAAMLKNAEEGLGQKMLRIFEAEDPPLLRIANAMHLPYLQAAGLQKLGKPVLGCHVGNIAMEMSTLDDELRECSAQLLDGMAHLFERAINDGLASGEIVNVDPGETAKVIVAYLEGAMMFAKAKNDPEFIKQGNRLLFARLFGTEQPNITEQEE